MTVMRKHPLIDTKRNTRRCLSKRNRSRHRGVHTTPEKIDNAALFLMLVGALQAILPFKPKLNSISRISNFANVQKIKKKQRTTTTTTVD